MEKTLIRNFCFITPLAVREWSIVTSVSVRACLCVRLSVYPRAYLQNYTFRLRQIFVYVTCGHGSDLVCRNCDTLCTSGFVMTS